MLVYYFIKSGYICIDAACVTLFTVTPYLTHTAGVRADTRAQRATLITAVLPGWFCLCWQIPVISQTHCQDRHHVFTHHPAVISLLNITHTNTCWWIQCCSHAQTLTHSAQTSMAPVLHIRKCCAVGGQRRSPPTHMNPSTLSHSHGISYIYTCSPCVCTPTRRLNIKHTPAFTSCHTA